MVYWSGCKVSYNVFIMLFYTVRNKYIHSKNELKCMNDNAHLNKLIKYFYMWGQGILEFTKMGLQTHDACKFNITL